MYLYVTIFALVKSIAHNTASSSIPAAELLRWYEQLSQKQLIQLLIAKDLLLSQKEEQLFSFQSIIEQLKQAQEELLKKVEECTNMLFGKKSERFTQYSDDAKHGRQLSLGEVFETGDIKAVVEASRARTAAEQQ